MSAENRSLRREVAPPASAPIEFHPRGPLVGRLIPPGDKSISHRALFLGAISSGSSRVCNICPGEDIRHTVSVLRALGVSIRSEEGIYEIDGVGLRGLREPDDVLDCGNAGTGARLLLGLLAAQPFAFVVTGDPSLRRRPMDRVIRPLVELGAHLDGRCAGARLPVFGRGDRLKPARTVFRTASAQVKSSLLLAALCAQEPLRIQELQPTRDHTEIGLCARGVSLAREGDRLRLAPTDALRPMDQRIPGDLSSAAFFIVAASIIPGSRLYVEGVGINPRRRGIIDVLVEMGAAIDVIPRESLEGEPVADLVVRASELAGIQIGPSRVPSVIDEIPVVCIAAAFARGRTEIRGAGDLRWKESDRIRVMARMLGGAGVRVEERDDGLIIEGGFSHAALVDVDPDLDHRVAMAAAVLGCARRGGCRVSGFGCVRTSYPGFLETLRGMRGDERS